MFEEKEAQTNPERERTWFGAGIDMYILPIIVSICLPGIVQNRREKTTPNATLKGGNKKLVLGGNIGKKRVGKFEGSIASLRKPQLTTER